MNYDLYPADVTDTVRAPDTAAKRSHSGNLISAFTLSYVVGALMLIGTIGLTQPWEFLSITRLLDLLIDAGVVKFHDMNPGFILGIPDVKYYHMSQELIAWHLVFISAVLFILYSGLKAIQFHWIARAYGLEGTLGLHARAYLYGDGIDRVLPFNVGTLATAQSLANQGLSRERAASAFFVSQVFTVFELAVFASIGLFLLGWATWFSQILWALVILGAMYYITCMGGMKPALSFASNSIKSGAQAFRALAKGHPGEFIKMCLISLVAFALFDLAVDLVMMAFNSPVVYIYQEPSILIMAIVSGYIARLVHFTPGGIGQWELGFATAFYVGGFDISVALLAIAFLANLLRLGTGCLLMAIVVVGFRMHTGLREVFTLLSKTREPAAD